MKLYLLLALCLLFVAGTYGACFKQWLIGPDDEQCEIDSRWDDKDECVHCYCTDYGYSMECCDMNMYPVIQDNKRCMLVEENCDWKIVPKKPQWAQECSKEGNVMIG
ncbi:uncharacterized protein [Apostichopus japonicus]|uniref:uncharacterized protein n=1 Tax=Stichopus japonicus TaxID=307972 RepID=UPI003AB71CF0